MYWVIFSLVLLASVLLAWGTGVCLAVFVSGCLTDWFGLSGNEAGVIEGFFVRLFIGLLCVFLFGKAAIFVDFVMKKK